MALKEPFMVKHVTISDAKSATLLTAGIGEAYRVKGIRIYSPTAGGAGVRSYVTFRIDRTTVGFYEIDTTYLCYIRAETSGTGYVPVFETLINQGIFPSYPIATGESLVIDFITPYTTDVDVLYEVYDAGDVNPASPNGSKATEYYYINYGSIASAITATGYYEVTTSNNPEEFPDFPFGAPVPPNTSIEVLGYISHDIGRYVAAGDYSYTTYLKFAKGMVELFDPDKLGLKLRGTYSASAGYYINSGQSLWNTPEQIRRGRITLFNPPLTFNAGEELKIKVGVQVTGTSGLEANVILVPLLMHLKATGR